ANAISVQDGLGDFTVVIEPDSTVTSGGGSGVGIAIESTADDSGLQTQIHEITAIVTVQKAWIADRAMNAVTTYVQSSVEPGSGPLYEDSDFDNYHVVVRGAVESAGGGAIHSDSNLHVLVLGDETADAVIATTSDNTPGVVATGAAWFAADFADLS